MDDYIFIPDISTDKELGEYLVYDMQYFGDITNELLLYRL